MKTKILLTILVESIFWVSCSHVNLSCDEYINRWAEDHLPGLTVNVERSEITEIPLGRQLAVYNGLGSDVKYELWREKFEKMLQASNLTDERRVLFHELLDFISPGVFEADYSPCHRFFELQAKSESVFAQNPVDFFFSVCTWMTEEEYNAADLNDYVILTRIDPPGHDEPQKNCTCRHDIGCLGQGGTCEKTDNCEQQKACGFLGQYYCNGICD